MKCPRCHGDETRVLETRDRRAGRYRREECRACHYRWPSIQIAIHATGSALEDDEPIPNNATCGVVVNGSNGKTTLPVVLRGEGGVSVLPGISAISPPEKPDPKSNLIRKSRARVSEEPPGFRRFWALYPRKKARVKALEIWVKRELEQEADAVISALQLQCPDFIETMARDPHMVPHPATWLNGERWKDEVDRRPRPVGRPARSDGNVDNLQTWLTKGTG